MIRRGDIVLVPFPFSDLSSIKRRPALVVSSNPFNRHHTEAIFAFITSKDYSDQHDLTLDQSDPDFHETGLKKTSTLRVAKMVCLEQKMAKSRLGRLPGRLFSTIDDHLRQILGL
jgi:mRNA interferase MazF